mgnify:CR=1 FL=1
MTFTGWTDAALDFFEGLEIDNSRAYWQAHKNVYDEQVRAPMEALLAELSKEFGEGKVFRPHRDIRFSADKTPYKNQSGASLAGHGNVQVSADRLAAASGDQPHASASTVGGDVRVDGVWMPPWGPDKITDGGRGQLRALGFNV